MTPACILHHGSLFIPLTLDDAIQKASDQLTRAGIMTARLDAELLLSHILQKNRAWIFTHIHETLDPGSAELFHELTDRRARREPLQYIVGRQEFWGLEFKVTPDVLIPRPETELVVEAAINVLKQTPQPAAIDLCTGSGCIAVSLANELRTARVFATDTSDRALAVARENARKHGVMERIRFLEGDLFRPLEELDLAGKADVITANPPYVQSGDLPSLQPEVRDHEPLVALIAGPAGTEIHQRIIGQAPNFLKQHGILVMEMGIGQSDSVIKMVNRTAAYSKPEILKDLSGIDRVIIANKR